MLNGLTGDALLLDGAQAVTGEALVGFLVDRCFPRLALLDEGREAVFDAVGYQLVDSQKR